MNPIIISDSDYENVLGQLDMLMQEAEQITDVDNKVLLYNILQYFDSVHREPLSRMMSVLRQHPEAMREIASDSTVQKLCSLYDLEIEAPPAEEQRTVAFIPESEIQIFSPPKKKDWLELGQVSDLENEKAYPKNYERVNFLISKVGSEVYAISNQCVGSMLPIDPGTIEGHYITCPWHGCKYDMRTGKAVGQEEKQLDIFPVEIEDDGLLKVEISYL